MVSMPENKIKEILDDPVTYPVFESNDDGALVEISGVYPLEEPVVRGKGFTSYRACTEFVVNTLKTWNDPRLPIFCGRGRWRIYRVAGGIFRSARRKSFDTQ